MRLGRCLLRNVQLLSSLAGWYNDYGHLAGF
jgi:hypothetical protein